MIKLKNIKNTINEQTIQGINFDSPYARNYLIFRDYKYLKGNKKGQSVSGTTLFAQFQNKSAEKKAGREFWEYVRDGMKNGFLKKLEPKISTDKVYTIDQHAIALYYASSNLFWHGGTDESIFKKVIGNIPNKSDYKKLDRAIRNIRSAYQGNSTTWNDEIIFSRGEGTNCFILKWKEASAKLGDVQVYKVYGTTFGLPELSAMQKHAAISDNAMAQASSGVNGLLGLIKGEMDPSTERDELLIHLVKVGACEYDDDTNSAVGVNNDKLGFDQSSATIKNLAGLI